MKYDIVIAGVGGQGVLSLSAIIASSALQEGLYVKQAEVHGMAQRGGAVVADLRLSDQPIYSSTIPRGTADLILSMEPLESLRYLGFLSSQGSLLTSDAPVINIPDYPSLDEIKAQIETVPRARLIAAEQLAKQAGAMRATNMVMVGAASSLLPLQAASIEAYIRNAFASKGDKVVDINIKAFHAGREAMQ